MSDQPNSAPCTGGADNQQPAKGGGPNRRSHSAGSAKSGGGSPQQMGGGGGRARGGGAGSVFAASANSAGSAFANSGTGSRGGSPWPQQQQRGGRGGGRGRGGGGKRGGSNHQQQQQQQSPANHSASSNHNSSFNRSDDGSVNNSNGGGGVFSSNKRGRSGGEEEGGGPFRSPHPRHDGGGWQKGGHSRRGAGGRNNNNSRRFGGGSTNNPHTLKSVLISSPIRAQSAGASAHANSSGSSDGGGDGLRMTDTATFFPDPSPLGRHSVGVDTSDHDDDEVAPPLTVAAASGRANSSRHTMGRATNSTGTMMTPQTIRPRGGGGRHRGGDNNSYGYGAASSMTMPTPDGVSPLQDPTVFVSPYVRLVAEGDDPNTTIRTLESLLKYGTANIGNEDDTPFLAPMADPCDSNGNGGAPSINLAAGASCGGFSAADVSAMLKMNSSIDMGDIAGLGDDDDDVALVANHSIGFPSVSSFRAATAAAAAAPKPPSPGLRFSLDGVATPNTWGAITEEGAKAALGGLCGLPQMISLPPATDPHTGATDFSSGLSSNKSMSTPESSMYRFLLSDYCRETDSFGYRNAAPEMLQKFMQRITDLCAKVTAIMSQECLMCAVATPVYVLGDIHGNFADLSYFLKAVLAFNDIHLSPCNVLCLGDYVDRGPYSLECVLLLFALKATAPAKVTLLRGNHEDRVVCGDRRTYGSDCFLAQCQGIFGQTDGMAVFIMVTEVFRHLPLAAEIVVSNAPNNPQAPRDLADEDDWESVPNTSMAEAGKAPSSGMMMPMSSSGGGGGCNTSGGLDPDNSPNASASTLNLGPSPSSSSAAAATGRGSSHNPVHTPEKRPLGASSMSASNYNNPPKTPKNAFRVEQSSQRDVRKMFTDRNWLRRQTHVERILCTHGGIPRFSCPPKEADSLAFLRSATFPRLLTLFPNNPLMREHQPAEVERFRHVSEEVMQRAWFTMFDLMWSDPTVDDTNVNEWGFGINTRGNTVVSFSAKAVETFLDAYKYSMLFRAHQEKAHGIRLSKSKKVLTIFSTSNYLGHGNGAGCAVVSPYGEVQLIVKTAEQ